MLSPFVKQFCKLFKVEPIGIIWLCSSFKRNRQNSVDSPKNQRKKSNSGRRAVEIG